MQNRLYKNYAQGRRVTTIVESALASNTGSPVLDTNALVNMAPQLLTNAWVMQNALLRRRAKALVAEPCQQHGITISMLGEYPLFKSMKLVRGNITDVVIVPAEQDPLFTAGKFPMPKAVSARLRAMEKAGVPFDLLHTYIAHEVPCNSVNQYGPLPLEIIAPPAPAGTITSSRHLGAIAHALTVSLLKRMRTTTKVGALATAATTAILLDPLIFGAIADERGMATWFLLAQWVW